MKTTTRTMPQRTQSAQRFAFFSFFLCGILFLFSACSKEKAPAEKPKPVPVAVAEVVQKSVPLQLNAIGNVEASSSVYVRSQVGGTLTKVHFREGQDIEKGGLLFTIDPRPFEAALRQAEAALARSNAQLENARAEEKRYAELVKKGYVAQTQYDQLRTNADVLGSTVQADRALVENARLNLEYTVVRSPVSGRTGSLAVHEGNLVKANADAPMVTIHKVQPVNVVFSVPEKVLPDIRKFMAGGELKIEASVSKEDKTPAGGRLSFIENAVDPATGTIKLKGSFENRDRRLWPGQFVDVVLTLAMQHNAVVAPAAAVQVGQKGQFVFVVKEGSTAEPRPVVVSRTLDGEAVIDSGLTPGEKVVTDGQLRLMPGAKVEIKK